MKSEKWKVESGRWKVEGERVAGGMWGVGGGDFQPLASAVWFLKSRPSSGVGARHLHFGSVFGFGWGSFRTSSRSLSSSSFLSKFAFVAVFSIRTTTTMCIWGYWGCWLVAGAG